MTLTLEHPTETETVATETAHTVSMTPDQFVRAAINAFAFSSTERNRPILTGGYLHHADNEWRMVSTDSYCLCIETLVGAEASDTDGAVNIPRDALKSALPAAKAVIKKRLGDFAPLVVITWGDRSGSIAVDGSAFAFDPIEGSYPSYDMLIPSEDLASSDMVALNPKFVAKVGKVATEYPETVARFTNPGNGKPVSWKFGSPAKVHVLQMPVRVAGA